MVEKILDKSEKMASGVFGAVALSIFQFLYGEGDAVLYAMVALVTFIALDWIAGIRAAEKDTTYASKYGIDGVFRTFFMLLMPAGGNFLDKAFQLPAPVIFGLLVGGLIHHTIKSMTANAIRAGWGDWLPKKVLDWLVSWVWSELENKMARSKRRINERRGGSS